MAKNPVVLIHGYSDKAKSFDRWREKLKENGYDQVEDINVCGYESLTNEVTIKDIAEGFDRALRLQAHLKDDQPFDAIVHSTGMLVIRSWLTTYNKRRRRLNRLIGLAPASFGSPLAHEGRSFLGAIFKGRKELGPDFLEAGDKVLDGLELGSRFTWDLAHLDLLPYHRLYNTLAENDGSSETFFGRDDSTPYVFIFCGTEDYGGLKGRFVNKPGTDGTVRWAGCSLRTRKIILDLTRDPARSGSEKRFDVLGGTNIPIPLIPVEGLNHSTILKDPTDELIEMVVQALAVSSGPEFDQWHRDREEVRQKGYERLSESSGQWAQFVIHAVDERGDPIPDYHLQLFAGNDEDPLDFDMEVYRYKADTSFSCYHVDLSKLNGGDIKELLSKLHGKVIASSGSSLVTYHGFRSEKTNEDMTSVNEEGKWDARLDFSALPAEEAERFFRPFTTTLIELKLNREPTPLDVALKNKVCWWE